MHEACFALGQGRISPLQYTQELRGFLISGVDYNSGIRLPVRTLRVCFARVRTGISHRPARREQAGEVNFLTAGTSGPTRRASVDGQRTGGHLPYCVVLRSSGDSSVVVDDLIGAAQINQGSTRR